MPALLTLLDLGHDRDVVALAELGRLLVVLAGADVDHFQRQQVVALVVLVARGSCPR